MKDLYLLFGVYKSSKCQSVNAHLKNFSIVVYLFSSEEANVQKTTGNSKFYAYNFKVLSYGTFKDQKRKVFV